MCFGVYHIIDTSSIVILVITMPTNTQQLFQKKRFFDFQFKWHRAAEDGVVEHKLFKLSIKKW